MTDTTDLGGTLDLDELWALRAEQAARRDDADARIARLDEEVRVLYAQQADERADAACQRADANAEIAQLDRRIRIREAADAAGAVEILAAEVSPDGAEPPKSWSVNVFCNSPHPTGGTSCKRIAGHAGDHVAYMFRITEPETWPTAEVNEPEPRQSETQGR